MPPILPDAPITKNTLLAGLAESVHEIGRELDAWRTFGADVVQFLKSEGLNEKFGKWQTKRAQTAAKKRPR